MFSERDEIIRHLKIQSMVIQRQFNDYYTPGLHKALECVRDYARVRPLTLDKRSVRILVLADAHRRLFDFVLLQLSRKATLRILIQAESATTAPKYTTTPELSTNHLICECEAPEFAPSIDIQLKYLVRPVLLTYIIANAPILTEIVSISETVPNSLIRHQKTHNSDLHLKKPVPPLVFGNHTFDPERHSHTYSTLSPLPSNVPLYPSVTNTTPPRELIGSWGQRPGQPGSGCNGTSTTYQSKPKTTTRRSKSKLTASYPLVQKSHPTDHGTQYTSYTYRVILWADTRCISCSTLHPLSLYIFISI